MLGSQHKVLTTFIIAREELFSIPSEWVRV